ncbi:melanopsin-A isoform X1 [Salmo salar]|uniref:Long melanopsin isoform X1 n=1 Tax=Salmo salar TaxID=8030 RepID=I1W5U8_SALSA|nr:long melanopsin isoform X1 [Salmo salar]AFI61535.1 short melanopsin [Salmo salar]|eukprot:XP_014056816.1 PREDICTED: long melanopsin isoform X1 [Salmo salar]
MSSGRSVLEGTGGAMNGPLRSVRKGISCRFQDTNCTRIVETLSSWNDTVVSEYQLGDLPSVTSVAMVQEASRHPFPTVDVPDHVHYTIGVVILAIGITGMVGNFLVIYAFSRSRSLRTPANMFIINLAITDLLMCLTQAPIFFTTSMHKRWIFGEKGCELYAFCGALFGICSMITLMVIAVDRYFVITRPLASIGVLSKKRALLILMAAWVYSLGWSLPPFFGWSAYVPEGLLTSCSWDYVTFTPSVRAYTMLLFTFVFFIPLIVIMYCYFFIFRAIRTTNKAVTKINCNGSTRDSIKSFRRLKNEWKMAKIALIVILLYVISWSPYSVVALTAFAGYADFLTPYMNSVPAVIAKASAIHNPIIYAITHPKYRMAIAKYIPCLGVLLCVRRRDLRSADSSFMSTRRSTVTSQTSDISDRLRRTSTVKSRLSSASDSESGWTDTEADLSSMGSRPASRQVSCDISKDTTELPALKPYSSSSFNSKMKSHDSGIFEKAGDSSEAIVARGVIGQIPSIVITSETSPFLPVLRASSRGSRTRPSNGRIDVGSVTKEPQESVQQRSTLPSNSSNSDASTPLI